MPDISTIITPDGQTRHIKDSTSRNNVVLLEQMNGAKNTIFEQLYTVHTHDNLTYMVNIYDSEATLIADGSATLGHGINTFYYRGVGDMVFILVPPAGVTGYDIRAYDALAAPANEIARVDNVTPVAEFNFTGVGVISFVTGTNISWSNARFKIMMLPKAVYDAGFTDYKSYSLPNTVITPELIELVDSGAKNKLNTQGATITPASGVTITRNNDGTFTINRSTSGSVSNNYVLVYINAGSYMLSGAPAGGSNEQWILDIRTNESESVVVGGQDSGSGAKVTIPTSDYYRLTFRLGLSYSGTLVFKPMLCSKAAWDVSQKYVPYGMSNAELTNNISTVVNPTAGDITFNSQLAQVPTVQAKYITQSGKTVNIQLYIDLGTAPTADTETIIGTLTGIDAPKNLYRGFCMVGAQYFSSDFETCFVGVGTTKNLYIKPRTGITNTKYMINITYQTN